MKSTWTTVVIYEDTTTRDAAVVFCDEIVRRFWAQCEFDAHWWSFELLQEPEEARRAAAKAAAAKVIVFATHPQGEMPFEVMAWIESWLPRRDDREGALIGLLDPELVAGDHPVHKHPYLRSVANRAGMDYLTRVPQNFAHPIPDSIESYSERAGHVGGVLDEILHHHLRPPQVLL